MPTGGALRADLPEEVFDLLEGGALRHESHAQLWRHYPTRELADLGPIAGGNRVGEEMRQTFLDRICKDPHDINARLVYADWLEESGLEVDLARAEYIRLSCQYYGRGWKVGEQEARRVSRRLSGLLSRWEGCWLEGKPLVDSGYKWFWHRGFVESLVATSMTDWVKRGPLIVRSNPVWTINCRGVVATSFADGSERRFRSILPAQFVPFVNISFIEWPGMVEVRGNMVVGELPECVVRAVNEALVSWARHENDIERKD